MTITPALSHRLASVVANSEDAILTHSLDGTIDTWNPAAQRLLGYAPEEVVGRPVSLIVPGHRREADDESIRRIRGGEPVGHFETEFLARDGSVVAVSQALSLLQSADGQVIGISRIARDLSGQKALERAALRLAAIVDSSEDAIVSKDLNGIVQTWNKAAERMFGYPAEEIVGRSITMIIPPDRLREEEEVLRRIRAGIKIEHFETIRRHKDGSLLDISLSVSPIKTNDGTIIGASKIARDITLQRRLARQAEEANRVKDEFLATLSHELRTPLNAVLGYTRMLRTGHVAQGTETRAIEIVERNAKLLSQLVSDVLDVSSIVTGKIRLTFVAADLPGIVTAASESVMPAADAKGVALTLNLKTDGIAVRGDADRLQQVFWNLLSNAVKFTPRGGRIDVTLTTAGGNAVVTVADTGIGIRPESLPFLFQRFWQAEHPDTRHVGGLGLGLALARHFIELHGGSIAAVSAGEGQGSTFTVTLPLIEGL